MGRAAVVELVVQHRLVAAVVNTIVVHGVVNVHVISARVNRQNLVQEKTVFAQKTHPKTHRDDGYQGSSRVTYTRELHLCYFFSA